MSFPATPETFFGTFHILYGHGSELTQFSSLAYCELYFAVAALALRVIPRLELFETTIDDVKYHHDLFVPMAHPDSKGVRVVIK